MSKNKKKKALLAASKTAMFWMKTNHNISKQRPCFNKTKFPNHHRRSKADLSPSQASWIKQDGEVLWVTRVLGVRGEHLQ